MRRVAEHDAAVLIPSNSGLISSVALMRRVAEHGLNPLEFGADQ